jgi:hypothetical protein
VRRWSWPARSLGLALAGEVLVSSTVSDLVAGSGLTFTARDSVRLQAGGESRDWALFALAA